MRLIQIMVRASGDKGVDVMDKDRVPPPRGGKLMNMKQAFVGIVVTGCLIGAAAILPSVGQAQDAKVETAMGLLKSMAAKMGPPKIEGTDTVAGKQVPAIYFGSTKMNNNFDLVDEVVKQVGGTATIFVKSGMSMSVWLRM